MALGATAMGVVKAIVVEALRPTFVGIVVGMAGAARLSWILHSTLVFPGSADFFYRVPFYDPATFLGLFGFLIIVAGIVALVPARRAVRVNPMTQTPSGVSYLRAPRRETTMELLKNGPISRSKFDISIVTNSAQESARDRNHICIPTKNNKDQS